MFTGPGRDQTPRYAAVLFRNHPSDFLWTQLSASIRRRETANVLLLATLP